MVDVHSSYSITSRWKYFEKPLNSHYFSLNATRFDQFITSSDKLRVYEKSNVCYIKGLKQSGKKRVNTYYYNTISAYPSQPANKTADSWPHSIVVIVTSPALHVGCKINEDVWARVLIHLIGLILSPPPPIYASYCWRLWHAPSHYQRDLVCETTVTKVNNGRPSNKHSLYLKECDCYDSWSLKLVFRQVVYKLEPVSIE